MATTGSRLRRRLLGWPHCLRACLAHLQLHQRYRNERRRARSTSLAQLAPAQHVQPVAHHPAGSLATPRPEPGPVPLYLG